MFYIDAPPGLLCIQSAHDAITDLSISDPKASKRHLSSDDYTPTNAIEEQAAKELLRYFDDPHHPFSVAIQPSKETPYRHKVWTVLQTIVAGERMTYQQVAKRIKSHPRPVGGACRNNSILIIIPCHRVVPMSKTGDAIGSYMGQQYGAGRSIKQWLLAHETDK